MQSTTLESRRLVAELFGRTIALEVSVAVPTPGWNLSVTDLFAGAGGSSTGMVAVPGIRVIEAANHWKLALDVHNANHPHTVHKHVDLHEDDPRNFARTDILWASPECTKWSQAAGVAARPAIEEGLFEDPLSDDAANRSRLLMFDVLRFAEHHRYRAMVVENVVDIATQAKYRNAWRIWRRDLANLGYQFNVVSLNSMHAQALGSPAPQSRDRLYVVCRAPGRTRPRHRPIHAAAGVLPALRRHRGISAGVEARQERRPLPRPVRVRPRRLRDHRRAGLAARGRRDRLEHPGAADR